MKTSAQRCGRRGGWKGGWMQQALCGSPSAIPGRSALLWRVKIMGDKQGLGPHYRKQSTPSWADENGKAARRRVCISTEVCVARVDAE